MSSNSSNKIQDLCFLRDALANRNYAQEKGYSRGIYAPSRTNK